jgi:outer membrane murein-binding lipoprotein Lpp
VADLAGRAVSQALAAALADFRGYLVSDDFERGRVIEASDEEALRTLVATVDPQYPEINAALDRLTSAEHPLPGDLERLEMDLGSLAQAAMEAKQELAARAGGTPRS